MSRGNGWQYDRVNVKSELFVLLLRFPCQLMESIIVSHDI